MVLWRLERTTSRDGKKSETAKWDELKSESEIKMRIEKSEIQKSNTFDSVKLVHWFPLQSLFMTGLVQII